MLKEGRTERGSKRIQAKTHARSVPIRQRHLLHDKKWQENSFRASVHSVKRVWDANGGDDRVWDDFRFLSLKAVDRHSFVVFFAHDKCLRCLRRAISAVTPQWCRKKIGQFAPLCLEAWKWNLSKAGTQTRSYKKEQFSLLSNTSPCLFGVKNTPNQPEAYVNEWMNERIGDWVKERSRKEELKNERTKDRVKNWLIEKYIIRHFYHFGSSSQVTQLVA